VQSEGSRLHICAQRRPEIRNYPLTDALQAFEDLDQGRLPGTRAILVPA
jgi:hypothetical protein